MGLKKLGNIYKSKGQAGQIYDPRGISPSIVPAKRGGKAAMPLVRVWDAYNRQFRRSKGVKTLRTNEGCSTAGNLIVSGQTKSTNTPAKSTERTSEKESSMKATSEKSRQMTFPTTSSSRPASLARAFRLLESGGDLKILEGLYSMKSQGFWPLKDLHFCYWKTSKDYYHTIMGTPLEQSSQPFLHWGIFCNGKYLTARISESRRTGRGCSLSDILEKDVPGRYFLSSQTVDKLMLYKERMKEKGCGFDAKFHKKEEIMSSLKVGGKGADDLVIVKEINAKFQKTVYSPKGISPTVREGHGDVVRIRDDRKA